MNERIKELIAQAREPLHNKNLPFNQGLVEYSEKFAELIVRECIGICEKDGQWYTNTGWLAEAGEAMSLSDQIKEHFGVK
jgi:hypothetical protein